MSEEKPLVADLFCGAGGSSTGAEQAVESLGKEIVLVCVNHWPLAIETHRANHPTARHYIEDVMLADPEKIVPEGYLDLLMASPECTHYSRARGGKPSRDQSRMNPWALQRWLTTLDVRCVLVENVPEFVGWGPLDEDGRPDKRYKGQYFLSWLKSLWNLGYTAEWKFLNAADYGDATTRRRFFLIARKDGRPIRWPEPTHSKDGGNTMLGMLPKWRAAREIIDWGTLGRSLLDDPKYRKKPLAINTRRRIARGLEKYGGQFAPLFVNLLGLETDVGGSGTPEGFTIANRSHSAARSMDEPVQTATASNGGGNLCLVKPTAEPFVLGQQSGSTPRSTGDPIPTVAGAGAISLVDPQLVVYHGKSNTRPVDKPTPSQPTHAKIGLVQPSIVKYYGTKTDTENVDEPLSTVTTKGRFGLVEPSAEPFIIQNRLYPERDGERTRAPHSIEQPLPAVTGHGAGALVEPVTEPFIVDRNHPAEGDRTRSVDSPLPTITTHHTHASLIEPVLQPAENSADVDPRRLVMIDGKLHVLDIRFRMLTNRELARAMGFDDEESEYEFLGNVAEVTKQIGNAVPVNLAAALVKAIIQ